MFKRITFSAILVLALFSSVTHGLERNIQEVLEERIEQAINGSLETGTLPLIVSRTADYQVVASDQEPDAAADEPIASSPCKCDDQAPEKKSSPESFKVEKKFKKLDKKKEKSKKDDGAEEAAAQVSDTKAEIQRPSAENSRVQDSQEQIEKVKAGVDDEIDSKGEESEEKLTADENVDKKPKVKKSSQKEKNNKRNKRDTKGGTKGKPKKKGKRSTGSESKGSGRKTKNNNTGSKNKNKK